MYIKRDRVLGEINTDNRILLSLDTKTGIVGEHEYQPELIGDCSNAVLKNGMIHFTDKVEKSAYIKYDECRICYKGESVHIYIGGKYHVIGDSHSLGVLNLIHLQDGMLLYVDESGNKRVLSLSGGIAMKIDEFRRRLIFGNT